MMGGKIGFEPAVGSGSMFWFSVRFSKRPPEAGTTVLPAIKLHGLRACIVDDHPTNRRILEIYLKKWGLETVSADSGPQAIRLLHTVAETGQPCALAILDMEMPGMNGLELGRAIKADPALSSTQLLLLTSIGQRGYAKEAHESGFEAYLTKPVHEADLYASIATVMGRVSTAFSSSSTPAPGVPARRLMTRHVVAEAKAGMRNRILLAEDNIINQKVAVRMLEKLGHRVDVVANGLEALEALTRIRYAVIVMDCQMPEMDGFEATAEIRKREGSLSHTPIIAMTADAMQGDRERCLQAGMDDYVAKPVNPEMLEVVLNRWLPQTATTPSHSSPVTPSVVASTESEEPIDETTLNGLRELTGQDDPAFFANLLTEFLSDTSRQLATLQSSFKKGSPLDCARAAHGLKGSANNLGAKKMALLCAEIQVSGKREDLGALADLIERLEDEYTRVRGRLNLECAIPSPRWPSSTLPA
jgi:CheY-like chemotaxis protein